MKKTVAVLLSLLLTMLLCASCMIRQPSGSLGNSSGSDREESGQENSIKEDNDPKEEDNKEEESSKNDSKPSTKGETVAKPLTTLVIDPDCAKVMDPANYFGDCATLYEAWSETGWWEFEGNERSYNAIIQYIDLLLEEYDFAFAAEPYQDAYKWGSGAEKTNFEFTLNYAGDEPLEADLKKGNHTGNKGDVVITGSFITKSSGDVDAFDFDVRFNENMKIVDEGYRVSGKNVTQKYCGDSFGVGLIRNSDGSFETSDGRLKASAGEAMLLTDGKSSKGQVSFNLNAKSQIQEIIVTNTAGIPQIAWAYPIARILTDDMLFDDWDLLSENSLNEPYENLTEKTPDLRYEGFRILRNERYYMPQQGMLADFEQVNMRVMYVDEDYTVAVIYFCADFSTKPKRTEGLIAVALNEANGSLSDGNAEVFNMKVGEKLELEGPYESDSMYNTHEWSIVSGSEYCEIPSMKRSDITVIARKAGKVRIKVVHGYTEEVYNSVLDSVSDEPRKVTKEYVINISE